MGVAIDVTTDDLFLSRARLRRDTSIRALLPVLLGSEGGASSGKPGHHLMWYLFTDEVRRTRDFLWRELEPGLFLTLSARRPEDPHGLFAIDEPKRFAPLLERGDHLRFSLRANPVVRRRVGPKHRLAKHDVVMHALRQGEGERAARRLTTVREAGLAWIQEQGARHGFRVQSGEVLIDGYAQHRIRRRGSGVVSYSTLDFDGVLCVEDPSAFLVGVSRGFGSAKAYGCGLMLLRRA